jgi:hypothetical protein
MSVRDRTDKWDFLLVVLARPQVELIVFDGTLFNPPDKYRRFTSGAEWRPQLALELGPFLCALGVTAEWCSRGGASAAEVVHELRQSSLSDDKQRYHCADQKQKSRKGERNAYLFKPSHDAPANANVYTGSKNNGCARLRLLSVCRHNGSKIWYRPN